MRTLPATMTVLAAAAVLTGGCGGEQNGSEPGGAGQAGPSAPGQVKPVILPEEALVSSEDSGDLPEATTQVALDCQKMSQTRDFAGTARAMEAVASSADSPPSAKALAKVCQSAANANQSKWQEAFEDAQEAEQLTKQGGFANVVSPSTQRKTLRMLNRSKMHSALAIGDAEGARQAYAELERLGGVSQQDLWSSCSVASDPSVLPECATVKPPAPGTATPSDEQPPPDDESSPDEPGEPTDRPEEPTESGPGTTDGPTDDQTDPGDPAEPTDEGDSPPGDDGPAPAES
ncbi:hypothetical protein HII36_11505 [Nonomuraea sp. NN258]|uniref:hypothetical protein n=1 Tax=Nonomuraea antri TaxID=2730852 RepID=UPI001568B4DE|nr:hypothetical protein [Nonomuraea antri]NRQ32460.1 hypothetical protein [Nonomuraea antri]